MKKKNESYPVKPLQFFYTKCCKYINKTNTRLNCLKKKNWEYRTKNYKERM